MDREVQAKLNLRTLLSACAITWIAGLPAYALDLHAEQITHESVAERQIGGPDAIGGVGDWYLANDIVEIIIDDPSRRRGTVGHGGFIVDAGLRDKANEDQFVELFPVINLSQQVRANFDTVRTEVNNEEGWARVVVSSSRGMTSVQRGGWLAKRLNITVPSPERMRSLCMETSYTVHRGEPFVRLVTTVHNRGSRPAPFFAYGDLIFRGRNALPAWLAHDIDQSKTIGFNHRSLSIDNAGEIGQSMVPATHVAVIGAPQYQPISYGMTAPQRVERGLASFAISGRNVTGLGVFLKDYEWDAVSLPRLARVVTARLAPGETWRYERIFVIAGHDDVEATMRVMAPRASGIVGSVQPAHVQHSVLIENAKTGGPVNYARSVESGDRAGTFSAGVPPGTYRLHIRAQQRKTTVVETQVVDGAITDLGTIALDEPAWLEFDPAFADGGPGRIIFKGVDGTPDPRFHDELLDFTVDGERMTGGNETREVHFAGTSTDLKKIAIAPGSYRLTAARGLEYDAGQFDLELTEPGAVVRLPPFDLRRIVELPGYVSADFHVHSQASHDTTMSDVARVKSFVAGGVDVLVSTDHDNIGDLAPAIRAVGVEDTLYLITGTEVTGTSPSPSAPYTIGHTNAWPIAHDAALHANNSPPNEGLSLAQTYETLRESYGAEIIQLNHPRGPGTSRDSSQYFTHLGSPGRPFDPDAPIELEPNRALLERAPGGTRAIDFDAIEVMNGTPYRRWLRVRQDWFSLLKQGYRRTGTANSDTHAPEEIAAYPRSYVAYTPRDLGWDEKAFNEQVKVGRIFGTTGPLFTIFTVNGVGMGDMLSAPDGQVTVEIEVSAAPWVPVNEVRILVNGTLRHLASDLPSGNNPPVVRFHERFPLMLDRDAFIIAEAGAPAPEIDGEMPELPGGVYNVVAPHFIPAAFTNPIYVDTNGNGRYDPLRLTPPPSEPTVNEIPIPVYVFGAVAIIMAIAIVIACRQTS